MMVMMMIGRIILRMLFYAEVLQFVVTWPSSSSAMVHSFPSSSSSNRRHHPPLSASRIGRIKPWRIVLSPPCAALPQPLWASTTTSTGSTTNRNAKDDANGGTTTRKRPSARRIKLVGAKKNSTNKKKKQHATRGWEYRIRQLQQFYLKEGHTLVAARHEDDFPGLYQWTRTVRSRYRHQHQQQKIRMCKAEEDDADGDSGDRTTTTPNNTKKGDTMTTTQQRWLSDDQFRQLVDLGFCWDAQEAAWNRRLDELRRFHARTGHCRVPNNSLEFPGLGIWVRNQRREHAKLTTTVGGGGGQLDPEPQQHKSSSRSTLTPSRLQALQELDFEWYRSHQDAWQTRYEQLVEYYERHGHSNVPQPQTQYDKQRGGGGEDDHSTAAAAAAAGNTAEAQLGHWCMNQRTAYRNFCKADSSNPCVALTEERIEKLQAVNFQWNLRQHKWQAMLERLQRYHQSHGHVNIAVQDEANKDLRLWLIWQRYLYNSNRCDDDEDEEAARSSSSSSSSSTVESSTTAITTWWQPKKPAAPPLLTEERIRALEEAIPNFAWKARSSGGPSSKDWAKLFDAMRDKGFQPGMRPKQHWFEGTNPFTMHVKSTYTEQDLLELWNQDADDDYDDEDGGGGLPEDSHA